MLAWANLALGASPAPLPGRWYPDGEGPLLEALGYAGAYVADGPEEGVVLWDPARAWDGTNLYSSGHAAEALLVGMDGRVLHRWSKPFAEAFPTLDVDDPHATGAWRRVTLRPEDGHLLAIFEGIGLVRLDARSRIVWAVANRAHHEARFVPEGVLVLTRLAHPGAGPRGRTLLEDHVTLLDADGNELHSVSVLEALRASSWASLLARAPDDSGDLLHTNGLFPVPGSSHVLLSFRHLDALALLDLDDGRLVWAGTGSFSRQHDAEVTAGGDLLLFDNRGGVGQTSRVLRLEPGSLRILRSYAGEPGRRLDSDVLGAVQELPNGNWLVTESTRGRAVEIDRTGDRVWEYHNPHRAGDELVAAIFEMVRAPPASELPWLGAGR